MRQVRCSALLCLGFKLNSSLRSTQRLLNSFRTLVSRIFSKTLSVLSSRHIIIRYDEGSAESFPGFSMKTNGYLCKLEGNTININLKSL